MKLLKGKESPLSLDQQGCVSATQVIVQPWRGRHQVYGLFLLPLGTIPHQIDVLQYRRALIYCPDKAIPLHPWDTIPLPPGHYLFKGFLKTRTALMWIMQGRFQQLRQPHNWRVFYTSDPGTSTSDTGLGRDLHLGSTSPSSLSGLLDRCP